MLVVHSKESHVFTNTKKEENSVKFLVPNKFLSKHFINYFKKFSLIEIPEEFLIEVEKFRTPGKFIAEKYFDSPLELLFTSNIYKNMDMLFENALAAYKEGKRVHTNPQGAAYFVQKMHSMGLKISQIELSSFYLRIENFSLNFAKVNNTKTSPYAIERFLKLFSLFHTKTMTEDEITLISQFQTFLTKIDETRGFDSVEELDKYIKENLTVNEKDITAIIFNQKNLNDERIKDESFSIGTVNIYYKLIELIKNFYRAIENDKEFFITECSKLVITPTGARDKSEFYFKNILKDVIPNYKQIDDEQCIREEEFKMNKDKEESAKTQPKQKIVNTHHIYREEETNYMNPQQQKLNICMLIDADNASVNAMQGVINELSKNGNIIIRKAYGNWSRMSSQKWENAFRELAIQPVHQIDYTKGKNATDIAMAIDAVDLMYTNKDIVNAFALVTSDSDFTPLAIRLVQQGLTVFGFGEDKTPAPFVNSCSQFIYTENLQEEITQNQNIKKLYRNKEFINIINKTIEAQSDESGWAKVAAIGAHLGNRTSLSPISYGFKNYGELLRSLDKLYEFDTLTNGQQLIRKISYD